MIREVARNDLEYWLAQFASECLLVFAQFFVVGCLLYGICHFYKKKEDDKFSTRRWPVVLAGAGLVFVYCGWQLGRIPGVIDLVLPFLAFLLGVWIVSNGLRGWRSAIWIVPKLGIVSAVAVGVACVGFYLATSHSALAFKPTLVSAEGKAHLAELIQKRYSFSSWFYSYEFNVR